MGTIVLIGTISTVGGLALFTAKNDNMVYINSTEPQKRDRAQIYRWADAMGNGDGTISRLEFEVFLKKVAPYSSRRLVNTSIVEWTDEEVAYIHKEYRAFCKYKGR